jgi:PAS domain S-box-containing protein
MNRTSFLRNPFSDKSRALFNLLCAGLIIFGVASFISFRQFETARNNSLNADNTAASLVATVLAEHEKTGTGVLTSYAQRPSLLKAVKENDLAAVHHHLEEMKRNNPEIDLIFVTDKDATIWANYPIFPEAIGQNVSNRDWYQGVSARWEPYTSSVFPLIIADKPLASATAVPIMDEKGEVIGILGNSHRLDYIAKIIQSTYLNPDTAVNVIDQKGQLLFSNKYPFRDKITDYPLLPVIQQAIKGNEHLIEAPEQSTSEGKIYLTQCPVEHVDWKIVVERRHADILRSTYRGLFEISAIAILLFSLAGFFMFYQQKVVLLRKTEELFHAEQKLRESEQAELETRSRAEKELKKAMNYLREREEQLRLFVGHAPAAIAMFDVQRRYIAVSRRWLADYGLTGQDVLGRSHYEIFPEIPDRWKEIHQRCMTGVVERSEEDRFEREDGSVQFLRWEVRPWESASGHVGGVVIFSEDITERKRAEQAVRDGEERLRFALETNHTGAWDLDLVDHTAFRSQEHDRIFGYATLLPQWTYEMFLGHILTEDRAAVDAKFSHAIETRSDWSFECRIRRTDGEVRWIAAAGRHCADAAGTPRRMAGIVQDITERKRDEEAVRKERDFSTAVLDTAGALVIVLDKEGKITRFNLSCEQITGYTAQEVLGRVFVDFLVPPEELGGVRQAWNALRAGDFPNQYENHWVAKDGTPRLIAWSNTAITRKDGEIDCIIGTGVDITERKRAEEKLRLSEESLRQANEHLEQRVQERTAELKERAEQLARLSSQLTTAELGERKRLSKILHDGLQQYLVAAKMQAGGLIEQASDAALKQAAIELENLLGESIGVSRSLAVELSPPILHEAGLIKGLKWLSRWMSDKHGLEVQLVTQMETPILTGDVKALLFESVREHLLNVVKHARTSSAMVELSQEGGRSLRVTVSDNGQGFDPATIPVFGDEGGGFGLFSICERINLIGGRFEIDSSPGRGARFTLTVPLAVNEPVEPVPGAQPVRLDGAAISRLPRPDGKIRILLADDHTVMREGLARLLSHEADFEIVGQANDGQEAVELAGKLDPDVVLMDISMPRINGIDATRLVHQLHPNIRIIGLSLYKEEERAKEMLDAGAVFYLTKSGPAIELKTAIRSSMRDRQNNERPLPRL